MVRVAAAALVAAACALSATSTASAATVVPNTDSVGVATHAALTPGAPASKLQGNAVHAATSDEVDALFNSDTSLCMDDSTGYGLRGYGCNSSNYQDFTLEPQTNGSYVLQNVNTGLCVDDSTQYGLRGWTCNGQTFQEFWVVLDSEHPHWYTLQSVNTGLCVDDSAQYGLRGWTCNGQTFQDFNFWAE
jgi:opacity protein-like surface antigen